MSQTNTRLDTDGSAATDDLDTINGLTDGDVLILSTSWNSRDVTVKHGRGNIYLTGSNECILGTSRDRLVLVKAGTEFVEVSRSVKRCGVGIASLWP